MQAYQSAPCPYCGATWNPPGAQACTNCHNQLPPPQPSYAPPGYAPQQGQPQQNQGQNYPYGAPSYPQQPGYPQAPIPFPGSPQGYPGQQQPGQPYQGQPGYPEQQGQYPGYPQGYGQGYPGAQYGTAGYPGMSPTGAPASPSTTLQLFGRAITVPVALPPVVVQYQQQIAYALAGLLALVVLLFGVAPAVASSQISAASQSLVAAASHQAKVDAGFASFFAPDSTSSDLNVLKTEQGKTFQSVSASLAIVQADESALNAADQRLMILAFVAPPSGSAIARERATIQTTLTALKQADTALTAGSNMSKVLLPLYDAKIDYAHMSTALNKHDLVGAAAPYPDAQQKVQQAQSAAQATGVPAVLGNEASTLNTLLDNTESLVQSIQNKDAAGVKKYSDAIQAGLKTMAGLSLPADYEVKTYAANQKAYDASMKSLKS